MSFGYISNSTITDCFPTSHLDNIKSLLKEHVLTNTIIVSVLLFFLEQNSVVVSFTLLRDSCGAVLIDPSLTHSCREKLAGQTASIF